MSGLFTNIKKEQNKEDNRLCEDKNNTDKKRPLESFEGFKTAKQYLECKRIKLDNNQTTLNSFFKSEVRPDVNTEQSSVKETVEITKPGTSETVEHTSPSAGLDEEQAMEDSKGKSKSFKLLFGDESDTEESETTNNTPSESGNTESEKQMHAGQRITTENDVQEEQHNLENIKSHSNNSSDYKHSKKKLEDRKRKLDEKPEETGDKKKTTNENPHNSVDSKQNGACKPESSSEKPENKNKRPRLKKSEIGTLVVKLLTPAYAERRFDSRDTFKSMARTISHALLDKGTIRYRKRSSRIKLLLLFQMRAK